MQTNVIRKLLNRAIAQNFLSTDRPFFHYAFALKKNRLVATGKSNPEKTDAKLHREAKKLQVEKFINYPYPHAEYSMMAQLNKMSLSYKNLEILVLRINRHGMPMHSKPCIDCMKFMTKFNPSLVWYSDFFDKNNAKLTLSNLLHDKIELQLTKLKKGWQLAPQH
jgi:hypothetical protein